MTKKSQQMQTLIVLIENKKKRQKVSKIRNKQRQNECAPKLFAIFGGSHKCCTLMKLVSRIKMIGAFLSLFLFIFVFVCVFFFFSST